MYELSGRWQQGLRNQEIGAARTPQWMRDYLLEQQRPSEAVIRAQMEAAVARADAKRIIPIQTRILRELAKEPYGLTYQQLMQAVGRQRSVVAETTVQLYRAGTVTRRAQPRVKDARIKGGVTWIYRLPGTAA